MTVNVGFMQAGALLAKQQLSIGQKIWSNNSLCLYIFSVK
jgi:hypothetical protein